MDLKDKDQDISTKSSYNRITGLGVILKEG